MNHFNHKNVQLAYEAVYNQDLCESMEDLGLIDGYDYIDEGRGRWGDDMDRNRRAMQNAMLGNVWSTHPASRTNSDIRPSQSSRPQSNYRKNLSDTDRAILALRSRKARKTGEDDPEYTPSNKKVEKALRNLPLITKNPKKRRRQVAMGEDYLYDLILEYLIQEGYADTLGSAEIILENMSEDWIEDILNEASFEDFSHSISGRKKKPRRPGMAGYHMNQAFSKTGNTKYYRSKEAMKYGNEETGRKSSRPQEGEDGPEKEGNAWKRKARGRGIYVRDDDDEA